MSIVLTERMAILKKMEYLEKERASLLESYDSCLDRLRELDEIDRMNAEADHVAEVMKKAYEPEPEEEKKDIREEYKIPRLSEEDLEKISIRIGSIFAKHEGEPKIEDVLPTEVVNSINEESIATLNLENSDIVSGDPELEETQEQEGVNFPIHKEGQSLQEYFEENKESLPNVEEPNEEVEEDKPEEPVVGTDHKNLQMKPALMRGTTNDNRIVAQFAKVILKDFGTPIKAKRLIEKLRDTGIVLNSPYETLKQIMQYEPGIQRVGHGFYQYVSVHSKTL